VTSSVGLFATQIFLSGSKGEMYYKYLGVKEMT